MTIISAFWQPSMEMGGCFGRLLRDVPGGDGNSGKHKKPDHKREPRCKTMQALQRALSEAQKKGIGEEALKKLIREHKMNCEKCKTSGSVK